MKLYFTQTLVSDVDVEVPDDVVAAGKVFEWLDENDCWPEFEEVLQDDWHEVSDDAQK